MNIACSGSTDSSKLINDVCATASKTLTEKEKFQLQEQDKRLVPRLKAEQLEAQAQRHWDLFYKRNKTRFFKDRRWTTREFKELLTGDDTKTGASGTKRRLLEVGCGVGNLIFPLIEDAATRHTYFYYACDFSKRAVDFVQSNPIYEEQRMLAFQCDITTEQVHEHVVEETLDVVTMVFVLSAIHPNKFDAVVRNLARLLKPGGVVLFRDYGLHDMAQLRFKPGHKIAENFYMRSDGTRSFFFTERQIGQLFDENGFEVISNAYVHRRTLNVKLSIDVPRVFLQGKFRKRSTDTRSLH